MYKLEIFDELNQQSTGHGKRKTREEKSGTENVERGKGKKKFRTGNGEL